MSYKVHAVLNDNGIQFTTPGAADRPCRSFARRWRKVNCPEHAVGYAFAKAGIDHRTTRLNHPWTNGQVERMNRTIKDATVKRLHYDDHEQL